VPGLTVIAIDWSGARGPGRHRGIWVTAICDGAITETRGGWRRDEVVRFLLDQPSPLIAGFDFSFGVPAWFARENGCVTIDDVWKLAARDGESWLQPTAPFWRTRCDVPSEKRFRDCERRFPGAKSVFQLVGNGQVGAGSVRGMPFLRDLRDAGFAIWPFDAPSDRTVVEIYPSALRRLAPDLDEGRWSSLDERDAVVSARVMWRYRETVAALAAATDPVTLMEGDVWTPPVLAIASP
jgi:hypothetical protein